MSELSNLSGIVGAKDHVKNGAKMFKRSLNLRNVIAIVICLTVADVTFIACNKDKLKKEVLNITAINDNISKIISVKLKSNEQKSFSIGCHVMSTSTFDARNNTFGYIDCNNVYHIIDVEAGNRIKQIQLPDESISLLVLDTIRNLLIGQYYVDGEDRNNGTDWVISIDLNSGAVVSNNQFYTGGRWDATTYFFRNVENEYVLLDANNVLVFINPSTGNVIRQLNLNTDAGNGVYDRNNNRLIGSTYSNETGKNYIVTIDLSTGNPMSKIIAEGLGAHYACEMSYDAVTNSYILVSSNNEVLFFDVATGKLTEKYQLDFDITSLKFWRSK